MNSRLTFHKKSGGIAWQKQIRDKFNDEGCPLTSNLFVKNAVVKKVSRNLAKQIILKYEWLGTMSNTSFHYGLFFENYIAGVCCYGTHSSGGVNIHKPFGISGHELCVLARGACVHWAPPNSNSKLVSVSSSMVLKDHGIKLIIAYSDDDAGEIGTIYQACNWVYIGKGGSSEQYVSPKGRVMDQKLASNLARKYKKPRAYAHNRLLSDGWVTQKSNPKGRYAFTKDPILRQKLEEMKKPYPKRPVSIGSDAAPIPG